MKYAQRRRSKGAMIYPVCSQPWLLFRCCFPLRFLTRKIQKQRYSSAHRANIIYITITIQGALRQCGLRPRRAPRLSPRPPLGFLLRLPRTQAPDSTAPQTRPAPPVDTKDSAKSDSWRAHHAAVSAGAPHRYRRLPVVGKALDGSKREPGGAPGVGHVALHSQHALPQRLQEKVAHTTPS